MVAELPSSSESLDKLDLESIATPHRRGMSSGRQMGMESFHEGSKQERKQQSGRALMDRPKKAEERE